MHCNNAGAKRCAISIITTCITPNVVPGTPAVVTVCVCGGGGRGGGGEREEREREREVMLVTPLLAFSPSLLPPLLPFLFLSLFSLSVHPSLPPSLPPPQIGIPFDSCGRYPVSH